MSFGDTLRQLRQAAALTQEELAGRSGISVRAISDIERGRSRRPYRDSVRRLADALGLSQDAAAELSAASRPLGTPPPVRLEPVVATPAVPAQLPLDIGDFVGRADELALLDNLTSGVADGRPSAVVVIAGGAGVGKTALAVHWAHRVRSRFPGGQLYLDLGGFGPGSPVDVNDALARLLRSTGASGDDLSDDVDERSAALRTRLADRQLLIVLDNARDAQQIRPLLPATGGVVLITSRNQMRGLASRDGARRISLRRLPIAEAIAVLGIGAGAARIDSELASVTELVDLCDRLPLALRIAAERISRFDQLLVSELVADLRRERDLLHADEQSTDLAAVFSWSYRALDGDAAALFRLLGLHPAGEISLSAAAALAGMPTCRTRAILDRLVTVHLVEQHQHARYDLHDLLRTYAADRAEAETAPNERTAAVQRMLEWYLQTADNARQCIQPGGRTDIVDRSDVETAALTFDAAAAAFEWIERHLSALTAFVRYTTEHGPHRYAWQLAWVLSAYLQADGDRGCYLNIGQLMLTASERAEDPRGLAQAHHMLGIALTRLRRLRDAIEQFHEALLFYRRLEDRMGEIKCLYSLGVAYSDNRQITEAIETLQLSRHVASLVNSPFDEALSRLNLGSLYINEKRYADGLAYTEQALAEFRRVGYLFGEATAYANLGEARAGLGDYGGAGTAWRAAFARFSRIGSSLQQGELLITIGMVMRDHDRLGGARRAWAGAERIFKERADQHGLERARQLLECLRARSSCDAADR